MPYKDKDQERLHSQQYYKKNKERIRLRNQEPEHKEYKRLYRLQYRKENKERIRLQRQQFYQEHREEMLLISKRYRQGHKEQESLRDKRYYREHKEKVRLYNQRRNQEPERKDYLRLWRQQWRLNPENKELDRLNMQKYQKNLKLEILAHYGNGKCECTRCGYKDERALSIDHINGNGNAHKKELGIQGGNMFYLWLKQNNYPEDFQTLCMNCQFIKSIKEKRRQESKLYKYDRKLKLETLKHYGNGKRACVKCGCDDMRTLSIDHINGDGKKFRKETGRHGGRSFYIWLKRNNYPKGHQTLCMNCQYIKKSEEAVSGHGFGED